MNTLATPLDVVGLVRSFLPELDNMPPDACERVERLINLFVCAKYLEPKNTRAIIEREANANYQQWLAEHSDATLDERLAHAATPQQEIWAILGVDADAKGLVLR